MSTIDHSVSVQQAAQRSIAAVRARLAVPHIPGAFARYLDQVYAAARGGVVQLDGQNIFLYRTAPDQPDHVDVEFGVGIRAAFAPIGNVRPVQLPVGEVATTTHWGPYAGLGAAHAAIIAWCRTQNRELAGPRWEVYGHWTDDEAQRRTDIYYLLRPATSASMAGARRQ
jgi:effector-binding domain-containing protein